MTTNYLHGVEVVEVDDGIRPIRIIKSGVQLFVGTAPGAADADFPLNKPVFIGGPRAAGKLGASGTLPHCYAASAAQNVGTCLVVRVAEDSDPDAQLSLVVGDPGAQTGVWAALGAASATGLTPKLLSAPGFTGVRPNGGANPVGAALAGVAGTLRAVAFVDGPDTTEADAIAARADYGSDRIYMVDPAVMVWDAATNAPVARPASAYVSAATAKRDADKGFWWSPSNQPINGIIGTSRPVGFVMSSSDTESNRLNEIGIGTIVHANGYRLWGNRTTATDPLWAFLSVRRTTDMVSESVEQAMLWAMDRPFSKQLLKDAQDTVGDYLRVLKARGAIIDGSVWIDPELNTETTLKNGELYINFDIEPPAPLERLVFRVHRNGQYYNELIGDLT